jgi:hypothetical protein
LAGVAALILPAFLERAHPATPGFDEHDRRVRELRRRVAQGTLTRPTPARPDGAPLGVDVPDQGLLLPVVVISSVAAAGVHAAIAPPHLREDMLVGGFFLLCAAAQLVWAGLMWHGRTPDLLRLGIAGNLGLLALWLTSRTVGVPGVGSGPEPIGPWDLTCALWEVVVVVGCLRLRHEDPAVEEQHGGPVHPFVLFWLVLSVLALGMLSISGAAA